MLAAISAGVWRSSGITATPRSISGTACANDASVSSPLAARVVVRPHRVVAELRAARRQRLRRPPGSRPAATPKPRPLREPHPLQQRHALDVRGLGKHVHRSHAAQPISGLDELGRVRGQRRRVAGHVDDPRRAALDHAPDDLLRKPGAGRVDDDHVGPPGPLEQRPQAEARVRGDEVRVADRVAARVLLRVGDRLGRRSRSPRPRRRGSPAPGRCFRCRSRGRTRAPCRRGPRSPRRRNTGARPSRCWSGRTRRARSAAAARRPPPRGIRAPSAPVSPSVPPRGPSTSVCRSTGGRGNLGRRGDEARLQLPAAPALADDEVAENAGCARGGRTPAVPRAGPVAHLVAGRVVGLRGEQAVRRRRGSGPSARGRGSRAPLAVALAERILELVAVAPRLHRRLDRLELEALEAADPAQGVATWSRLCASWSS